MNICQVHLGLLPIPPNGWGAVEKIVWEYHCNAQNLGHNSYIKYLSEINPNKYDIVHQHVYNLALEGKKMGINYIFTLHDHHAYVYGKNSELYKQNLEAIDKSIISFVPAKYLIPYFNNHPKLKYLEHGVNTEFFKPSLITPKQHKLLCVANNGFANDQGFDRKGFSYAINAAKILDIPITIAGPSNNKNFFSRFNQSYDKLTVLYDLNEEELLKVYQEHTIFLHPSLLEAGHPNLTLLEAMACGLPVIATFEPGNSLPGLYKIERDVNQIIKAIVYIINNYDSAREVVIRTAEKYSYENVTKKLLEYYSDAMKKTKNMKEQLIRIYDETPISVRENRYVPDTINITFVNGPKVDITGENDHNYTIEFIDDDTGNVEYTTPMRTNHWCSSSKQFFINWRIKIYQDGKLSKDYKMDLNGKNVYIALGSSSVGDTLAWFPIVEEFRKKHNCNLTVSTFRNDWFISEYPEIKFIEPGTVVYDLYAMYSIGWFYDGQEIDSKMNPKNFRTLPLQATASSILGMEEIEIKPRVKVNKRERNFVEKYVVIAPHASAHAKYWNYPDGWQTIIDYLNNIGYKVIMLTQEKLGDPWHDSKLGGTLYNVIDKTGDIPLQDRFTDILNADLFIGVGSGLSWVSWALGTKTMLISGFSYPYSEFTDCIRIYNDNPNVCTGCFNRHRLDAGDWEWCPDHKNTPRMFECTKTITPNLVIEEINKALNI